MTIAQLKAFLNVPTINLDRDEKEPKWLRSWDNATRTSVVVHEDTLNKIKAGESFDLKTSTKASKESGEVYTQHVLVIYSKQPDEVL